MQRALRLPLFLAVLVPLALPACSGGAADDGEEAVAVAPGKADDYLSPTSREYNLWGIGDVTLDATWTDKSAAEREARVRELLGFRFKAYAHYINVYVTNKEHEDANAAYGGFSGLVRSTSLDFVTEPVDEQGLQWTFLWELQMGGPRALLDNLPIQVRTNGDRYFLVKMPKLTESELVSGSYSESFDPATYKGDIEEIEVMVGVVEESFDAWPEYDRLFEDGRLDVLILVGGDYNAERYDIKAAREIFAWLKKAGWQHPAKTFEEVTLDSPPFTKTLKAGGRDVQVEATLIHADMVPDDQLDRIRARVIQAFETFDVVLYDGHAGADPDYSGVVYHYNPRAAISANALAGLKLPEKYQLYVFNGCKTYSAYPEALYKSATKTTKNLDIISTVNFSWLSMQPYTTSGFLASLLAVRMGTHDPRTYVEILSEINKSSNWNVYYGVHGLDDNPHRNPWADLSSLCAACGGDSDCPGEGNRCVRFEWGRACAAECTADDGCPASYACASIAEGAQITGRQCLPATYKCE